MHKPRVRRGGRLRLGFTGGDGQADGLHVLIDAVRLLARAPVDLHVHRSGHADSEASIALEKRAAGLPVTFHGRIDPRGVDHAYAGFDVLVVPSLASDHHPLPILEAFRNGLPVIATEIGGMSEVVHDGINGLLFARGDARALARSISALLADPELYNRLTRDRPPLLAVDGLAERLERLYLRFAGAPPARA